MIKPSFYWHDYETWGANPRVDRGCQFAGIRTDENLNIIDEPLVLYCQPAMDCLPHPEAVLITGITPQQADREGMPEAEFFKRIHAEFSRPASCVVGYNNIRFDDEVTRFGFYRNFIDPYAYSWQNSNSRWDILDLMRMAHALRPEGINWPENDSGVTSFKLTDLTAANDIEQSGAHDARVDVEATIALARLLKERQPRLFDYFFDLRFKQRVARLLNPSSPEIMLHVSGMFSVEQGCLSPVVPLLANPQNPNEIICYNLRVNPEQFLQLNAEQIQQKLYTKTLDLGEGEQRIPLKGIHQNKSPAVASPKTLNAVQAEKWQLDWVQIENHYRLLMADKTLLSRLFEVYKDKPDFAEVDADFALYEGFIGQQDRLTCNQLLAATPEQLAGWEAGTFQDERLQTLLFRYRARNYPYSLTDQETRDWQDFCQRRLIEGEFGAGLTLQQFQQQLITLAQQEEGSREQQLLSQLSAWVQGRLG